MEVHYHWGTEVKQSSGNLSQYFIDTYIKLHIASFGAIREFQKYFFRLRQLPYDFIHM